MKANITKIPVVIEDYQSGRFTNAELARRHGVTLSTIASWIRKSGLPRRRPGARPLVEPTPIQRQMIELSARLSGNEIARRFEVSKQRVHQVLTRWKHLLPPRPKRAPSAIVAPMQKKHREIRGKIMSFRLTAKQTDRIRAALMAWGFGNRLSDSAACRAVLLAAVGLTRFELPAGGIGFGAESPNNVENPAPVHPSEQITNDHVKRDSGPLLG